jgi:hypothetical protein
MRHFCDAWHQTIDTITGSPRRTVGCAVAMLILGIILAWLRSRAEAVGMIQTILAGASPFLIVCVAVYFFYLVRNPLRIKLAASEKREAVLESQLSKISSELSDTKKRLDAFETWPSLVIGFDKTCSQKKLGVAVMRRICVYLDSQTAESKCLEVILQDIKPLDPKAKEDEILQQLRGKHMTLAGDTDERPQQKIKLTPGRPLHFDVVKLNIDPNHQWWASTKLFICHAVSWRPVTDEDRKIGRNITGHKRYVREPSDAVTKMQYELTIRATAEHANSCIATFHLLLKPSGSIALRRVS